MNQYQQAMEVWGRLLHKPYLWGGSDPQGFDCSGLVIEGLKSAGVLPREGDWTADGLSKLFPKTTNPRPGCLIFWPSRSGSRMRHVEIVWAKLLIGRREAPTEDPERTKLTTIGASGGGSRTTTVQEAWEQDAYVKIREPASGWTLCVDPFVPG